ncbi:MAG TPA: rhomboid family intramembrane serine protease [Thermodesulfatator atlanticus]|uniref:Rhomboid family intramembrane serine protease n=1 Tax=Thermodesulfatator atlanticus TaxID=501497 RepID=A0A7V5U1X9_9BACT|nr:rhomboid family intramembrane serine protease [Thermodesulfatator atlanticus]
MFPVQDDAPRTGIPVATYLLIAINVAVFILEISLPPAVLEKVIFYLGVVPARYTDPSFQGSELFPGLKYLAFITCMFLHGGWVHLIGNMWTLWIFGDNVEDRMGSLRFVIFYFLCGLAASLCHIYMHPHSTVPTIGASGAISGVLGAYYALFPLARIVVMIPIFIFPFFFELPAVLYLAWWFFIQVFSGTLSVVHGQIAGGVAWWAHAGGFVAGLLLHRLFCWGRPKKGFSDERTPWGVLPLTFEKINR